MPHREASLCVFRALVGYFEVRSERLLCDPNLDSSCLCLIECSRLAEITPAELISLDLYGCRTAHPLEMLPRVRIQDGNTDFSSIKHILHRRGYHLAKPFLSKI